MIIHYNLTFSSRTVTYPLISQDHFVQLLLIALTGVFTQVALDLRHSLLKTLSSILTLMLTFEIQAYKYSILPWSQLLLTAAT